MTNNPPLPTGWSWSCPCGWATGRDKSLEYVERRREGHLQLHTAPLAIQRQAGIR